MNAISLKKSLERLKKCYVGKVNGVDTLDRSKLGDLEFSFAMFRVNLALESEEMTKEEFYEKLGSESES